MWVFKAKGLNNRENALDLFFFLSGLLKRKMYISSGGTRINYYFSLDKLSLFAYTAESSSMCCHFTYFIDKLYQFLDVRLGLNG